MHTRLRGGRHRRSAAGSRVGLLLAAVLILSAIALAMLPAGAQVRAHAPHEPPDASPFEGAADLFLRAPVAAERHWGDRVPAFATDGRHTGAGDHWAGENIPVWLRLDLKEIQEINAIRLWTYWDNRRVYQYLIEGSADGEQWATLVDHRKNTTPATDLGETFTFPPARVRQVRVTFTHNSASNQAGGHIVEIEGYRVNEQQAAEFAARLEPWKKVAPGLHAAFASVDERYARDAAPAGDEKAEWSATAWRGERVHTQALLWTADGARQVRLSAGPLRGEGDAQIDASCIGLRFVRYVLADRKVMADVLDDAPRLDVAPRTARPVWVSVDVPAGARPGTYRGEARVAAEGGVSLRLPIRLDVLPAVLPAPAQWAFWLDLWQNPWAVARYHRVQPWSEEHWRVLEPHLRLLASAGQKCVTTTLIHQPWGTQTYDPYESMVEWTRNADGTWVYDFTRFDRYVELCARCGIAEAINCYSMAPWGNRFRYLDEATGDYAAVQAGPGTPAYQAHWRPFLACFVAHLREKGWLGRTAIAMDERPVSEMRPLIAFLREAAPELRLALAGSNEPELKGDIHDWCVFVTPPLDPAIARERIAQGKPTTFYVCCGPGRPNTFTFSPPAEAAWLGWYAAAQGYSGFLRWAHDSWVEDPLYDTSFVTWPAGDCFLVYPGARSSIRFERLREGIQEYEKVRLVRAALAKRGDAAAAAGLRRLDEALARFTFAGVQKTPAAETVNQARRVLMEVGK